MNEDLIIKFAKNVGLPHWYQTKEIVNIKLLQEFAKLVAEHERNECAKVCDELETNSDAEFYGYEFSKAIRERGNP